MKDRKITVKIGRTINMGNYESLRADAGLESKIPDGEDSSEYYKSMWNEVNSEVSRAVNAFKKK